MGAATVRIRQNVPKKFSKSPLEGMVSRLESLAGAYGGRKLLAADMGVTPQTFSDIMAGRHLPTLQQIERLIKVRRLSPLWLHSGLGPQSLDDLLRILVSAALADKRRVEKIRDALLVIQDAMHEYQVQGKGD